MENTSRIPDRIRDDLPGILASWRKERGEVPDDAAYARLVEGMGDIVSIFVGFLRSSEGIETYSQGGATRTLVVEIAASQHELGRDAVGVIEDFVVLRRCVWRSVEGGLDLSSRSGGEVAGFFVKLMEASDWATENGLEAFDAIVHRDMEQALGRAAATDLVTGLPDRDQFNRLLLPTAIATHDRFSVVVFDVARFTETVAQGKVKRARKILRRLVEAVRESAPEGAVLARFGDDEVCAILPEEGSEGAYKLAEKVLERLAADPGTFEVDVGLAEYPAHGAGVGALMGETLKALKMAKRVGGGGIVVAR